MLGPSLSSKKKHTPSPQARVQTAMVAKGRHLLKIGLLAKSCLSSGI